MILITLLLAVPLACFAQDAVTKVSPKQPLQFIIKSDKEVYEVGEEINLTFIFCNNGVEDISFCRFLLKYNLLKRNIKLKNQRGDVYEVFDRVQLEMPVITSEDFITLRPNEKYTLELQLNTSFPPDSDLVYLHQGMIRELPIGEYQIVAEYENSIVGIGDGGVPMRKGWRRPNVIIEKHNIWTGALTSNTITIEVVEKK